MPPLKRAVALYGKRSRNEVSNCYQKSPRGVVNLIDSALRSRRADKSWSPPRQDGGCERDLRRQLGARYVGSSES